jgi:hypothetical protein
LPTNYQIRVEVTESDKLSSLFQYRINCISKKIIVQACTETLRFSADAAGK